MLSNYLYYTILALVLAGYCFATGYWVAQDRYEKKIKHLERQKAYLLSHINTWRFPHAPNDS